MIDDFSSDNPLDSTSPLDNNLISHMLSLFLKCNPADSPVIIPRHRLNQLCDRLKGSTSFHGDANIIESIGSIMVIALHFAVSPTFHSQSVFECASVLQTIMMECLIVMNLQQTSSSSRTNEFQILHPYHIINDKNDTLYETYNQTFSLCKEILRDIIRQIRMCRDKDQQKTIGKKKKKLNENPIDCFQPHTIYLFCCFGLSHCACVLSSMNNINIVPGMIESLCIMSTFVRKDNLSLAATKNNPVMVAIPANPDLRLRKDVKESRFDVIIDLVNKLGNSSMNKSCKEKNLLELLLIRTKVNKKLTHSDCSYAKVKASIFRDFLQSTDSDVQRMKKLGVVSDKRSLFDFKRIIDRPYGLPVELIDNPQLDQISLDLKTLEAFEATLVNNKHQLKFKEIENYWQHISNYLRSMVLSTRALRNKTNSRQYIAKDGSIKKVDYLNSTSNILSLPADYLINENISNIENIHHTSDTFHNCRVLDPSHVLYWVSISMIEFFYEKTKSNEGFCSTNKGTARELLGKVNSISKKRKVGSIAILKPVVKSSFHSIGSSSHTQVRTRIEVKKLGLMDRLHLATEEAKYESVLNCIENELRIVDKVASKDRELLRIDKRVTKGINVLQKCVDYEKKRSQLLPMISQNDNKYSRNVESLQISSDDSVDVDDTSNVKTTSANIPIIYEGDEDDGDEEEDDGDEEDDDGDDDDDDQGDGDDDEGQQQEQEEDEYDIQNSDISIRSPNNISNHTPIPLDNATMPILLDNPLTMELKQFKKVIREAGVIAKRNIAAGKVMKSSISSVWSSNNTNSTNPMNALRNRKPRNAAQAAKQYIDEIHLYQQEKKEAEEKLRKELEDDTEMQLARVRSIRLAIMHEKREGFRENAKKSLVLRSKFDAEINQQRIDDNNRKKKEAKRLDDYKKIEKVRIKEIRDQMKLELEMDKIEIEELKKIESIRLNTLADKHEWQEIIRRNLEEDRMRYLEERQRKHDDKANFIERKKKKEYDDKIQKCVESKLQMVCKIRNGNFMWHGGKYSFYEGIRDDPVAYVEHITEDGVPYYVDPLKVVKPQYDKPQDANIQYYDDEERFYYDSMYGKGSYDLMKVDVAKKDAINRDGGWFDDKGDWVDACGHYDENYEWVADEGYYDENGKYIRYAKVSGDLSFMV